MENDGKMCKSNVRKRVSSSSNTGINKYTSLIDLSNDADTNTAIENAIATDESASLNVMSDIWDGNYIFQIPTCSISRVEVIDKEEQQFGMWSERLEAFIISLIYTNGAAKVDRVVEQSKL